MKNIFRFLGPPWVSKYGKKGDWSSFLNEFLENIQNEDFGLDIF